MPVPLDRDDLIELGLLLVVGQLARLTLEVYDQVQDVIRADEGIVELMRPPTNELDVERSSISA